VCLSRFACLLLLSFALLLLERALLDTDLTSPPDTSLGDIGRGVTHVAMLMEREAVQSTFNVQKSKTVWASLGHSEFDLPGTSVGASRRRPGDNADMNRAVKTTTGDSGTANGSMMALRWRRRPLSQCQAPTYSRSQ
jgi:hypothetical protein